MVESCIVALARAVYKELAGRCGERQATVTRSLLGIFDDTGSNQQIRFVQLH